MTKLPLEQEQAFRDYLQRETGFVIPEGRWKFLAPRFFDRLEGRGFAGIQSYIHYLETHQLGRNEKEEIFFLLTVRKTSFFRNPASYQALIHEILPRIVRERQTQLPISVWSAGCSTGEEPYSLAMVAEELRERTGQASYILATDIVKEALATAREGSYPEASLASVPPEYRRFFRQEGGRARVDSRVKKLIEFADHNLVHQAIPRSALGHWDIVFCRNVLIYFDLKQATEIIRKFTRVIPPGGILFLGHAEVFTEIEDDYEVVFWGNTFYYRKRQDPRVEPILAELAPALSRPSPPPNTESPSPIAKQRPLDGGRRRPEALGRSHSETRAVQRPRTNPTQETSRWDVNSETTDTPTVADRRPRPAAKSPTPTGSRQWSNRLPRDLILQAERRLQAGDTESAARALRAASSRAPRWAKPRIMLAEIYLNSGEHDHAKTELEAAVEAEPLEYRAHYLLGSIHSRLGDQGKAEVAFRRALYLEPDYIPARYDLAQSLRARALADRACRELRSVLRSLRSLAPARLLVMTQGMRIPTKDLRENCEIEISEMGGTTMDSGVWRLPRKDS